jgi:hypothetical protein
MTERITTNDPEDPEMNAIPYDTQKQEWDGYEGDESFGVARRPRRQFLNWRSAGLIAVIVGAACFYAGVRVEKGQLSSSSSGTALSAASGRSGAASRFAGAGGGASASRAGGSGRSGTAGASGASSASGASTSGATGGFAGAGGGLAAAFGGGAGATFGTVGSIGKNALYVTDTSGNTVKVTLSSVTKVTKSEGVSRKAVRPGDTVIVSGVKNSKGSLVATSVSDSGSRASATGSSGGSSGSGGASSAVNSLFGSGSGG